MAVEPEWIDASAFGSEYECRYHVTSGRYEHRPFKFGEESTEPWRRGLPPDRFSLERLYKFD
jgi:hypothetical protein